MQCHNVVLSVFKLTTVFLVTTHVAVVKTVAFTLVGNELFVLNRVQATSLEVGGVLQVQYIATSIFYFQFKSFPVMKLVF